MEGIGTKSSAGVENITEGEARVRVTLLDDSVTSEERNVQDTGTHREVFSSPLSLETGDVHRRGEGSVYSVTTNTVNTAAQCVCAARAVLRGHQH